MTLTWEASYAIAQELRRNHPQVDLNAVSLQEIYMWTISLPEFEDDPSMANDEILMAIFQEWLEEDLE